MTRLLLYGFNLPRWLHRWGLEPFNAPCADCGRNCEVNIPMMWGTLSLWKWTYAVLYGVSNYAKVGKWIRRNLNAAYKLDTHV